MGTVLNSAGCAVLIFIGVLASLACGRRLGRHHWKQNGPESNSGLASIEAAVFGLMGLLIAFTFTGAANRFDERRYLISQHVNAIGTAWLRLDLLNDASRQPLRQKFRSYVDIQIQLNQFRREQPEFELHLNQLNAIQKEIWQELMESVKSDRSIPIAQTLLPPVNEMFDLATTRQLVTRRHPPLAVYIMLFLLTIFSSLMAGFGMAKVDKPSPLHQYGFAAILAISVYLILDMEHPRMGLIRVDSFDIALVELRDSMK